MIQGVYKGYIGGLQGVYRGFTGVYAEGLACARAVPPIKNLKANS